MEPGAGPGPGQRSLGDGNRLTVNFEHRMSAHIVPKSTYYTIFGLLMLGTTLTVGAAFLDLGAFNTVVALAIACTKATLVVLFFMHVKYSTTLTWAVVASAIFFLFIMLALTFNDYLTRHLLSYG
jgi:cytochrome c oxidase subunit IV